MDVQALLSRANAISPRLKSIVAIAVIASIALGVFAATVSHGARVALFVQRLRPEQLAEAEERLAEWNVPFISQQGNVLVDAPRRNELLLRLALAGVPHAHVETTNEALANVGMLTPQSVIDAQARAGLAGEIELALRGVAGVEDAHVIIAPARPAEFADQQGHDASASVRVKARAPLSRASIAGIRAFVAASVPGLQASNVTLLDDRGVALQADAGAGDDATVLQASLQSALDDSLGTGVALVRVNAQYSQVEREARDVRRAPLATPAIRSRSASETYDGAGKRYQKTDTNDDRGSDVQTHVARTPAGTLLHLTTAVFIDAHHAVDLAAVRALAAATVGFDPKRGDRLEVEAVDFHHARPPVRDGWMLAYGALVPLLPALALAFGAVVVTRLAIPPLTAAVKLASERAAVARTSRSVATFEPSRVRSVLEHEPPHAAAAIISALPAATAAAVLELYPPHEREAIVARMQRAHSPFVPDAYEVLHQHA